MTIKQLIINRINQIKQTNVYNNDSLYNLINVLYHDEYNFMVDTNYNLDIKYIISRLSLDNICKLCINRLLIFIIQDENIINYEIELTTLYLLNMKNNNIKYFNLILIDN